jgi:hypothetical protein
MSFRKLNPRLELAGFWNRTLQTTIQGILRKLIEKDDGPFFIIELTEDTVGNCIAHRIEDGEEILVQGKIGENIGCMANKTLRNALTTEGDEPYLRIGAHIRITALGTTASKTRKKAGKPVQVYLYDVEIDDSSIEDASEE